MPSFRPRAAHFLSLALLCGAAWMPSAQAQEAAASEDPVVADVDGTAIRRSTVLAQLEGMDPQVRQLDPQMVFPQLLERSIMRVVIGHAAEKANIQDSPAFQARLEQIKKDVALEVFLQETVKARMSEERVAAAYESYSAANPPKPQVRAAHILVSEEALAQDIIKKLNDGAKFADLALEHGKDSTRSNGGDLGWFSEGDMVPEFSAAAFAMEPGSHSKEPVKSQFGFHVIQLNDKRLSEAPKLDDVRGELESQISQEILGEMVTELREGAKIENFGFDGKAAQ